MEPNSTITLADCERYVGQAASYTGASGKRVGILCVLDCSKKTAGPSPAEDGISILRVNAPGDEMCIVTVLIQGNLPRPSDLSR